MDFDGLVKEIAIIDSTIISAIAEKCKQISWMQTDYSRGEPPLKEGRLVVFPYVIKPRDYSPGVDQRALLELCLPVCTRIREIFSQCIFIRGEIATLPPGVELGWHVDPMWFHEHCHRIHVPIITDSRCVQLWEGSSQHLCAGKIYEINNRRRHSARNGSEDFRVHLIFDLCHETTWADYVSKGGNPNVMTCDPAL
jgi:hypothetical protein